MLGICYFSRQRIAYCKACPGSPWSQLHWPSDWRPQHVKVWGPCCKSIPKIPWPTFSLKKHVSAKASGIIIFLHMFFHILFPSNWSFPTKKQRKTTKNSAWTRKKLPKPSPRAKPSAVRSKVLQRPLCDKSRPLQKATKGSFGQARRPPVGLKNHVSKPPKNELEKHTELKIYDGIREAVEKIKFGPYVMDYMINYD